MMTISLFRGRVHVDWDGSHHRLVKDLSGLLSLDLVFTIVGKDTVLWTISSSSYFLVTRIIYPALFEGWTLILSSYDFHIRWLLLVRVIVVITLLYIMFLLLKGHFHWAFAYFHTKLVWALSLGLVVSEISCFVFQICTLTLGLEIIIKGLLLFEEELGWFFFDR